MLSSSKATGDLRQEGEPGPDVVLHLVPKTRVRRSAQSFALQQALPLKARRTANPSKTVRGISKQQLAVTGSWPVPRLWVRGVVISRLVCFLSWCVL